MYLSGPFCVGGKVRIVERRAEGQRQLTDNDEYEAERPDQGPFIRHLYRSVINGPLCCGQFIDYTAGHWAQFASQEEETVIIAIVVLLSFGVILG